MPITNAQKKLLHTAKRALHLTDDEYRDILQGAAGVRTSSDLHYPGLQAVMRMFSKLGFRQRADAGAIPVGAVHEPPPPRTRKYNDLGHRPGMAEPAQLRLIELIWSHVSHSPEASGRSKGLRRWVLRQARVADLKFLKFEQAQQVIESLKKYYTRTHGKPWPNKPVGAIHESPVQTVHI